jgi:hypothetical protein
MDDDVYPLSMSRQQFSTSTLFFNELSPTASNTLLKFLTTLRTDSNFISSRLLKAADPDFESLVAWNPHHQTAGTKGDINAQNNNSADYVMSFRRHDPLYVLTSVIFQAPYQPGSTEYQRRLQCWSSCLAQLIDAKRGDPIVLAVLDIWWGIEWHVSAPFETAILGFLQAVAKMKSARTTHLHVSDDDESVLSDPDMIELLDKTVGELLNILCGVGGIPTPALQLLSAVYEKCADKTYAKDILFNEWFLRKFMYRAIQHPEVILSAPKLNIVSRTPCRMLY